MSRESPTLDELFGVGAERADAEAVAPAKPKRVNKKTREALEREFQRGYAAAMETDGGARMLGLVIVAAFNAVVFFALGAWIF